jgi:predicted secreted protein
LKLPTIVNPKPDFNLEITFNFGQQLLYLPQQILEVSLPQVLFYKKRYNEPMTLQKMVLALVLLFSLARAGDAATLEFIGFSGNGKYLAFEQFGVADGAGFPYAKVQIVDVQKNSVLAQTEKMFESENNTVAQARAALQTQALLKRFGITRGNQGQFIGIAPTAPNISGQRSDFIYAGRTYTLELNSSFEKQAAKTCPDEIATRLELTLTVAGKTRVLQKDGVTLPTARACALSYEMRSAHLLGKSLAVFVAVQNPGFEGADVRWMVITTQL